MSGKSLIALTTSASKLVATLIERGGEFDDDLEEALDLAELEVADKTDAYAHVIDHLELQAAHFKKEADVHTGIRKSIELAIDSLKRRMRISCKQFPDKQVMGHRFRFKLSRTKAKLIIDPKILDTNYFKEEITVVPDKDAIRMALEAGVKVAGAQFEEIESLRRYVVNPAKLTKGTKNGKT